ncbi:MAG: uroporphyrinogen-III C-methyltransferase, partial [Candidatus Omnitrophica bacterium]|nr:uroporphyrinogen-III C-methyltransferase [Candidatus Omnitrophota bacterium]
MIKKNKGKVFLVGVGPGNERLITLAAVDCIRRADVLIYDQLMSPSLLEYRKPEAVLIYAGKSPGRHSMSQEEINALLCKQALRHRVVVRLKGGDPLLFGRGSEEALALLKAGISFEIVPGVSSGFAVSAYAGIPLTHRGVASQVTFVTGHEDPTKSVTDVEWGQLAGLNGTLVIFMGMARLEAITGQLMAHGMKKNTPVCVVQWGTLPAQRSVTATIASIAAAVKLKGITHPAIIIIGEVVRLREKLNWYETKPLFGKKILITRPRSLARELSQCLEQEGAQAVTYPLIEVVREKKLDERLVLEKLAHSDWVIFTSRSAVEICFDILKKHRKDARLFARARIAVLGEGTNKELEGRGITA